MANSGIYVIHNTKTGQVYIGQTVDLRRRWLSHKSTLACNRHTNKHLQRAWNKYGANTFKFKVLEHCDIEQLDQREQHFLDVYMAKDLCYNIACDVQKPFRGAEFSAEHRRKIGDAHRGKPKSEELKRRLSELAKHRPPFSEETRRKITEANTGRPSQLKGRKLSEEHKSKISEGGKGRKHSEETKRKISEANKRRPPRSEETRQKISQTLKGHVSPNKGKKMSDEQKAKISETLKRRYSESETP